MKEEINSLRIFENRSLGRIFRPETNKIRGEYRRMHIKHLITCNLGQMLLVLTNQRDYDVPGYATNRRE
jgi:hypothetical protein